MASPNPFMTKREISREHARKLAVLRSRMTMRDLVATLHMVPTSIHDAVSHGRFKPDTAARYESAIDELWAEKFANESRL